MMRPGQKPTIAILIHETGEWEPVYDIHWKKIQDMVGGYMRTFTIVAFDDADAFVSDNGLIEGLPFNLGGIALWARPLAGKILVTGLADNEGNTMPITQAMMRRIVLTLPACEHVIDDIVSDSAIAPYLHEYLSGVRF
jgi:hypothetical protein